MSTNATACAAATSTSATVNFTGAVDRDLLKRAKIVAAKNDTSINAPFNAELTNKKFNRIRQSMARVLGA